MKSEEHGQRMIVLMSGRLSGWPNRTADISTGGEEACEGDEYDRKGREQL
jgi:hypothetical protein